MTTTNTPSSSLQLTLSSPQKKPQPIPWTHQETLNLIRAYQEKWYSLKRGPLRGTQWEEVAVVVAARCGYDYNHPSKTALQCRHKMEKLRQRHRSEKHRLIATSSAASSRSWQYFRLMDDLERGPLPISARAIPHEYNNYSNGERGKNHQNQSGRSRSIHNILHQKPSVVDDDDDEEEEEGAMATELTAELRSFAESIIGLENMKMEMMKETERFRLEMENKRMRMILESQWRIIDSIGRVFGSS
ncbi:trihelix transcription factor ENAP2 [Vicia villosa]|uniref:trihelix transcription factor ENAP2 n=1 Tax=Vicia villosa TaxID=3911 RepID=UPI00273C4D32|nr:trihelix transcription factor ENAP2 [Vicia villosa]